MSLLHISKNTRRQNRSSFTIEGNNALVNSGKSVKETFAKQPRHILFGLLCIGLIAIAGGVYFSTGQDSNKSSALDFQTDNSTPTNATGQSPNNVDASTLSNSNSTLPSPATNSGSNSNNDTSASINISSSTNTSDPSNANSTQVSINGQPVSVNSNGNSNTTSVSIDPTQSTSFSISSNHSNGNNNTNANIFVHSMSISENQEGD